MSGAWTRRYDALTSDATTVLHAVAALVNADREVLGAALARVPADVRKQLDRLTDEGWLEQLPDGRFTAPEDARFWLAHDAPRRTDPAILPADDVNFVSRLLDYCLARMDTEAHGLDEAARWVNGHRDELIAAVRFGVETGLHKQALALVHAAWEVAGTVPDPGWRRRLAEVGETAAGDQRELLDLRHRSAHTARAVSDLETAEDQFGRAAGLALKSGDTEAAAVDLAALATVLLDRDQAPRAVDVLLELADLHRATGNTLELATTLTKLGSLTLAGARPDLATIYLEEAEVLLAPLDSSNDGLRARANELLGRALWTLGKTTVARRTFRLAEQLAEEDPDMRARLQSLLMLSRDSPLPPLI